VKYDRIVDIGKPGKNLSWAIEEPDHEGADLDECIEKLIDSPGIGPVAIGGRIRLRVLTFLNVKIMPGFNVVAETCSILDKPAITTMSIIFMELAVDI
jgi:hypothetical protein